MSLRNVLGVIITNDLFHCLRIEIADNRNLTARRTAEFFIESSDLINCKLIQLFQRLI